MLDSIRLPDEYIKDIQSAFTKSFPHRRTYMITNPKSVVDACFMIPDDDNDNNTVVLYTVGLSGLNISSRKYELFVKVPIEAFNFEDINSPNVMITDILDEEYFYILEDLSEISNYMRQDNMMYNQGSTCTTENNRIYSFIKIFDIRNSKTGFHIDAYYMPQILPSYINTINSSIDENGKKIIDLSYISDDKLVDLIEPIVSKYDASIET